MRTVHGVYLHMYIWSMVTCMIVDEYALSSLFDELNGSTPLQTPNGTIVATCVSGGDM